MPVATRNGPLPFVAQVSRTSSRSAADPSRGDPPNSSPRRFEIRYGGTAVPLAIAALAALGLAGVHPGALLLGVVCAALGGVAPWLAWRTAARREAFAEARHRSLLDGVPVGLYRATADGRYFAANHTMLQMLGYPDIHSLRAADPDALFADPADARRVRATLTRSGSVRGFELLFHRRDGSTVWVRNTVRVVPNPDGGTAYHEGVLEDITERKLAEQAGQAAEAKFRGLVEQSLVGIYIVQSGRLVYANPKFCEIFGYGAEELAELPCWLALAAPRDRARVREYVDRRLQSTAEAEPYSFRALRQDGTMIEVEVHGASTEYRGAPALIGTLLDITRRKEAEERLVHTAHHDGLTGLPNRVFFMERLEHAFGRERRGEMGQFAVLFLDLNRFKVINDSLGHPIGDEMLVAVSARLLTSVRPGDTVARFGGDEFAVLLEEIEDLNEAIGIANRIQARIREPLNLSGYETFTSASIGAALSGSAHGLPEHILRNADMAMYRAKSSGMAACEVFDRAMHADALARLQLETDLRHAVEREQFALHYQPIVELVSGRITGFEALIRWEHPEHGMISPADFIPIAEETGLILPICRWVLREACGQLREWQEHFPAHARLSVGVNLSAKQLLHPELIDEVHRSLQETGLDPRCLKLEITESMLMENAEAAAALLEQMRSLGIQLYLDDFGTGYSSLSYLHHLSLDTLKIDRSFVSQLGAGNKGAPLVRTIVNLADNLGVEVVAEGVETEEQLDTLRELGCQFGQGYFFSRPLEPAGAGALLAGGSLCAPVSVTTCSGSESPYALLGA